MDNQTIGLTNSLVNTAKSSNKIKINVYSGLMNGNIIEKPIQLEAQIPVECEINSLDFSCPENSQYLGAI